MTATTTQEIDWGNWIYRLIALVIDSIIAFIPAAIIYWLLIIPLFFSATFLGYSFFYAPWWAGVFLLPFFYGLFLVLYSAFLEVRWDGETLGKRLLGLRVQQTSGKLLFDKAFIRNMSKIFWLLLLLDWLIGIATPGNRNQKYTDRMAGTRVVQTKQPFASSSPPPPPPPPPPA